MWLINSSIGRKVVMSVTGIALVLFLTFHAAMNAVALISGTGYNMICEFLGANWYAVVATAGLGLLVVIHFIYAFWITIQNRRARGNIRYEVTSKPETVEWASQNMLVLGIIIILGMALHLYNFWYNMMYAELAHTAELAYAANGIYHIINVFSQPVYVVVYLIWLAALWLHLIHGCWSSMQSLGWSGKIWFKRWKVIGRIYATIVVLLFASVAISFGAGYRPADVEEALAQQKEQVCQGKRHQGKRHQGKPACGKGCKKYSCGKKGCACK